jgi:hypothetical protein
MWLLICVIRERGTLVIALMFPLNELFIWLSAVTVMSVCIFSSFVIMSAELQFSQNHVTGNNGHSLKTLTLMYTITGMYLCLYVFALITLLQKYFVLRIKSYDKLINSTNFDKNLLRPKSPSFTQLNNVEIAVNINLCKIGTKNTIKWPTFNGQLPQLH